MNSTVKTWIAIDFAGQVLMLLVPLLWTLTGNSFDRIAFHALIALGIWQTASFFIHLAFRQAPWIVRSRQVYTYLLIFIGMFGVAALISTSIAFEYLFCMLFVGPAMGIFYLIITCREWQRAARMMVRGRQAL